MRHFILIGALAVAGPAFAQTTTPTPAAPAAAPTASVAVQIAAGASVVDATGTPVGTVDQVAGDVVTVDTGANKVGVPRGNFAMGANGLVLGNTKAQLDAAAGQAAAQNQAQVKALLVSGAAVHGTGGMTLGTVKSADADVVTLSSAKGDVRLPISGFAAGANGLVIGMTQAQFEAAVTAAKAQ